MIGLASCSQREQLDPGLYARITTNRGEILIALEPDKAPMTVMNFVGLAEGTIDTTPASDGGFYDGLTFHRVEPGFVIQGGDPQGNGTGGPGYRFPTETHPDLLHDAPGVVAMANSGPDTNGSQFYITMSETPHLDGGYNVFGHVIEGIEVVNSIEVGDTMEKVEIVRAGQEYKDYSATDAEFRAFVASAEERFVATIQSVKEREVEIIESSYPDAELYGETGIYMKNLVEGSGEPPVTGTTVSVHVSMKLLDGTELNDTRATGQPFSFSYKTQRLIEGLEISIGTLKVGGRILAIAPPERTFGLRGSPPLVPAGKYMVFDIERLE